MSSRPNPGDLVEVRTPDEILATLDADGKLDGLPFMPEMLQYSGRRFRVSRRAHKTCDTVNQTGGRRLRDAVHLEDLRCDGTGHGGCKAACLLFWKQAWLKPLGGDGAAQTGGPALAAQLAAHTQRTEDGETVYRCQATALYDATEPLKWWDPRQYVEDLTSGNVGLSKALRVAFFHGLHNLMGLGVGYRLWRRIYDTLQPRVGGHGYPFGAGKIPKGAPTPAARLDLQPGEYVRVKTHEEILETLDEAKMNRGMRFDCEMVPYCGKTYRVVERVGRIVNEKTGRMIEMGTPSVILDGVVCRSEFSNCRLFCPRAIPSYWREIWLERLNEPTASASPRTE